MMDRRPDLPELNSVELSSWVTLPLVGFTVAYMILIVAGVMCAAAQFWDYLEPRAFVSLGITPVVLLWTIARALLAYYYYKTDENGLTARGPLRKMFIPWDHIMEASWSKTWSEHDLIELHTNERVYKIMPDGMCGSVTCAHLIASIWQHLRRRGLVDDSVLPAKADSFWDVISDEVPAQMQWNNPRIFGHKANVVLGALCLLMFGGGLWAVWSIACETPHMFAVGMAVIYTLTVPALAWLLLREMFCVAKSVKIDSHGIEAHTIRGVVSIPWSEVSIARCRQQRLELEARSPRKEMWIPYRPGDENTEKLILAVIRRLRQSDKPPVVAIPYTLRQPVLPAAISVTDVVEVRPQRITRYAFAALAVLTFAALTMESPLGANKLPVVLRMWGYCSPGNCVRSSGTRFPRRM